MELHCKDKICAGPIKVNLVAGIEYYYFVPMRANV